MVLGVGLGGLCGAVNGGLIAGLRVVPFIVTLGTYQLYRGLATWLASNTQVYVSESIKPAWLNGIVRVEPEPSWLMVAPGVWMLVGLSVVLAIILRYSLLGRYAYAIGSNESTARLCGINVPGMKVLIYALGGLAAGLAGVLQFAYLSADGRPDDRRRARAPGDRRGRDRGRQPERRRGDRPRHPDRLPDHVGPPERMRPRRHSAGESRTSSSASSSLWPSRSTDSVGAGRRDADPPSMWVWQAPVDTLRSGHYDARRRQKRIPRCRHLAPPNQVDLPPFRMHRPGGRTLGNLIKVDKKGYPMNWGNLSASE